MRLQTSCVRNKGSTFKNRMPTCHVGFGPGAVAPGAAPGAGAHVAALRRPLPPRRGCSKTREERRQQFRHALNVARARRCLRRRLECLHHESLLFTALQCWKKCSTHAVFQTSHIDLSRLHRAVQGFLPHTISVPRNCFLQATTTPQSPRCKHWIGTCFVPSPA